jgi:hypothetical protein
VQASHGLVELISGPCRVVKRLKLFDQRDEKCQGLTGSGISALDLTSREEWHMQSYASDIKSEINRLSGFGTFAAYVWAGCSILGCDF